MCKGDGFSLIFKCFPADPSRFCGHRSHDHLAHRYSSSHASMARRRPIVDKLHGSSGSKTSVMIPKGCLPSLSVLYSDYSSHTQIIYKAGSLFPGFVRHRHPVPADSRHSCTQRPREHSRDIANGIVNVATAAQEKIGDAACAAHANDRSPKGRVLQPSMKRKQTLMFREHHSFTNPQFKAFIYQCFGVELYVYNSTNDAYHRRHLGASFTNSD